LTYEFDPIDFVRRGYDALSWRYRDDDDSPTNHVAWARELGEQLQPGARVLDLGCGNGVPLSRDLSLTGFHVTGIDASAVQIERASRLVPAAEFLQADMTTVEFDECAFDAVVCLYAIIHLPLADQPLLLQRIARWLRPGGWLLATTGHDAWTGTESGWLGGEADMWWSQADAATYRTWIADAGLTIVDQRFVPEGASGHELFLARRPPERGVRGL
jgi:2-polyprenyl-3-methyl-5-hydroxy-6-metoxy-1,4-benzoquinol methylase